MKIRRKDMKQRRVRFLCDKRGISWCASYAKRIDENRLNRYSGLLASVGSLPSALNQRLLRSSIGLQYLVTRLAMVLDIGRTFWGRTYTKSHVLREHDQTSSPTFAPFAQINIHSIYIGTRHCKIVYNLVVECTHPKNTFQHRQLNPSIK